MRPMRSVRRMRRVRCMGLREYWQTDERSEAEGQPDHPEFSDDTATISKHGPTSCARSSRTVMLRN